jgi:putative FmdB family regulatory protein
MAFYDYKCRKCDRVYEVRKPIAESDTLEYCEEDGSELVKQLTPLGLQFNGKWFNNAKEY